MENENTENNTVISDEEAVSFKNLLTKCMGSYTEKNSEITDAEWLKTLFQKEIPGMTKETANTDAEAIVDTIKAISENLKKLNKAETQGISKESWLAEQLQDGMDDSNRNERGQQLHEIEGFLYEKNMELADELNINEESIYDAAEDDVVIEDTGEEQEYSAYEIKELAMNVGKNAGIMGIQAAASTMGSMIADRIMQGEQIAANQIIQETLRSGMNSSLQVVASGALEIASQNELIRALPKETAPEVIASMASMGVEHTRIISQILSGKLSFTQGISQFGKVSAAVFGSIWNKAKNTSAMKYLSGFLPFLGPKIAVIADLVGTTVAMLGGTTFGKKIIETKKKVASAAKTVAKTAVRGLRKVGQAVKRGIKRVGKALRRLFS